MVGSTRYEIAQTAYVKLVLHALKHKTSAVNGVLIGRVSGVGAGDSAGNESGVGNFTVEICDSVPFFHSHLGLLPMLELALTQVCFLPSLPSRSSLSRICSQFVSNSYKVMTAPIHVLPSNCYCGDSSAVS
jgi:hypothetical protein